MGLRWLTGFDMLSFHTIDSIICPFPSIPYLREELQRMILVIYQASTVGQKGSFVYREVLKTFGASAEGLAAQGLRPGVRRDKGYRQHFANPC